MRLAYVVVAAAWFSFLTGCESRDCLPVGPTFVIPADTTLQVGQRYTPRLHTFLSEGACGGPADGFYSGLTWTSRDTTILSVDALGTAIARSPGETILDGNDLERHEVSAIVIHVRVIPSTAQTVELQPVVRDTTALFQTDSLRYTIRRVGTLLEMQIVVRFSNSTNADVYMVNCNGVTGFYLEKLENGEWKGALSLVFAACLSQPIVVHPGQTKTDTLRIVAGMPGSNTSPQFQVSDPSGTYRIVWTDVLSSYQDRLPFGPPLPLPQRISNAFVVVQQ